MKYGVLLLFSALIVYTGCSRDQMQKLTISSPDESIQIVFELQQKQPRYAVSYLGKEIIRASRLGYSFRQQPALDGDFMLVRYRRDSSDETWEQPWGEQRLIRNNFNELAVHLRETKNLERELKLIFRVFDDGIGFRYEIPRQPNIDSLEIRDEQTEFVFTDNHKAWWIPAYQHQRYEYLYTKSSLNDLDTVHTPLTMEIADGLFCSLHEAALTDYASMTLYNNTRNSLACGLVPWSDGIKVKTRVPFESPWRTIQLASTAGGLIESTLILNLNEPNRLGDVAWVTPGKYVGIWWGMHIGKYTWGSGERHGATTANAIRYIDFAANHGIDAVLIEGWNVGWDGDWVQKEDQFQFTTPHPDFDIEKVASYAYSKGVQLIGHHETVGEVQDYERQLSAAFAFYERLGIHTVKTGYVQHGRNIERRDEEGNLYREWHHGQFMVRHYRRVIEEAARHRIMLVVHEPIKATGIRRTYPNMLSREGARGQEYNAWSPDGGNPPEHTCILPFTRLLGGPLDFTPGIFDLRLPDNPDNQVNTTLAKQLALYVVIFSPLQMAAELIENYEGHPAFRFIEDVPVDWEDTRVLAAAIGEYVIIVRQDRHSPDWYLGAITNREGREFEIELPFLDDEGRYRAEIYADGKNTHWKDNPTDYLIIRRTVDCHSKLVLRLAPGGGQAIRFRKMDSSD